ncbi:hypothetical protein M408DRAFT_334076, partial [Serendipita vermifera MAFF 305830]
MSEHSRNLRAFAGTQFTRLASSNAVNRAYDLASKAKGAVEQAATNSQPSTPPNGPSGQQQSWKQWALEKIPGRGPPVVGVEAVHLFPGWATRRSQNRDAGFVLDLHIAGFASSLRPPEQATRSAKAFMAIARRMAALPPLPPNAAPYVSQPQFSASTQDILRSQVPEEEREAEELQALKAELEEIPPELRPSISREMAAAPQSVPMELDQLRRMHANLDMRLQPFWASGVPNRPVILTIFSAEEEDKDQVIQATSYSPLKPGIRPLFTIQTSTDAQGTFMQQISIPYETICTNPHGLGIAFGEYHTEPKLIIQAELKPQPQPINLLESSEYFDTPKTIATHISVPISNHRVRVISDIDDTVKTADVLSGVKKIFNNVFVKGLEELVVPGMSTFYQKLHDRGVRFHYVSNSPFGLLPILMEFLQVAGLPQGSLKLRFYGGRSLFGGLWEPAGERKRGGVVHVLDNFIDSKFFLIGDTGEQDLELYVDLAKDRPDQILGVFLRDVVPHVTPSNNKLVDDQLTDEPLSMDPMDPSPVTLPPVRASTPGSRSSSGSASRQPPSYTPYVPRSRSGTDPKRAVQQQPQQMPAMQMRRSFIDDEPYHPGRDPWLQNGGDTSQMSPAEKLRWNLEQRIARARQVMPPHIAFRVFRDPEELNDVFTIIDSLDFPIHG